MHTTVSSSIEHCSRFQSKSNNSKPIIVTFTSVSMRASFLSSYKTKKYMTASDIELNGTSVIGEDYTQSTKSFLQSAHT